MEAAISKILQQNFDADSRLCMITLIKLLDNVLQKPDNPKVRSIRLGNPAFHAKVVRTGGVDVLEACGFERRGEQTEPKLLEKQRDHYQAEAVFLILPESNDDNHNDNDNDNETADSVLQAVLVTARHMLAQVCIHQLKCSAHDLPKFQPPKGKARVQVGSASASTSSTAASHSNSNAAASFDPYQGQRFDGQSAAAGANLGAPQGWKSQTTAKLEALQQTQQRLERKLQTKVDRQWVATRPAQAQSLVSAAAFDSTTTSTSSSSSDASLLAARMAKQQQERTAAESRGFTTKAMRDLEQLQKQKVYSHTQLAVQFPDGCVVRGNCLPHERIQTVLQLLKQQVLRLRVDDGDTMDMNMDMNMDTNMEGSSLPSQLPLPLLPPFELYMTPPRTLLDSQKSLQELGLVRAAKVYVSWKRPLPPPPTTTPVPNKNNTTMNDDNNDNGPGWYLRPALFLAASAGTAPALPTSAAVVAEERRARTKPSNASASTSASTTVAKRKKTKAEKEANLLKRMLGN
jgi:hypothetical protein